MGGQPGGGGWKAENRRAEVGATTGAGTKPPGVAGTQKPPSRWPPPLATQRRWSESPGADGERSVPRPCSFHAAEPGFLPMQRSLRAGDRDLHVATSHGWKARASRNLPQLHRSMGRGQVCARGQGKSGGQAALLACPSPKRITAWPPPGRSAASAGHAMVLLRARTSCVAPEPQAGQRRQTLGTEAGAHSSPKRRTG